jgi:hypothetical protein
VFFIMMKTLVINNSPCRNLQRLMPQTGGYVLAVQRNAVLKNSEVVPRASSCLSDGTLAS